jgi:hypothetical protein
LKVKVGWPVTGPVPVCEDTFMRFWQGFRQVSRTRICPRASCKQGVLLMKFSNAAACVAGRLGGLPPLCVMVANSIYDASNTLVGYR